MCLFAFPLYVGDHTACAQVCLQVRVHTHIEFVGLCNGEFEGLCILVLLYYSPFLQISDVLCRVRGSVL